MKPIMMRKSAGDLLHPSFLLTCSALLLSHSLLVGLAFGSVQPRLSVVQPSLLLRDLRLDFCNLLLVTRCRFLMPLGLSQLRLHRRYVLGLARGFTSRVRPLRLFRNLRRFFALFLLEARNLLTALDDFTLAAIDAHAQNRSACMPMRYMEGCECRVVRYS